MSERKIVQRCDFAIKPTHQNRVISGEAVHDNRFLSNRSGFDVDDKKPRDVALRVGRDASVIPAVARKWKLGFENLPPFHKYILFAWASEIKKG